MREIVKAYYFASEDFIDIPTLEEGFIEFDDVAKGESKRIPINQRDKFTRRIFNWGSFEKGGRFFGGWWQRCPKHWRGSIFIDDHRSTNSTTRAFTSSCCTRMRTSTIGQRLASIRMF